jgi:hypothetical protein
VLPDEVHYSSVENSGCSQYAEGPATGTMTDAEVLIRVDNKRLRAA